ncbi:leucyl aminopeptidase family protein [Acidocella sp.]|uniref:leucyl aminopeptidase family protein n=1 Tax=Acidocella sp. TaxID=50710 RepID=UPI003D01D904
MITSALNFLDIPAGLDMTGTPALPLHAVRPGNWRETLSHLPTAAMQAGLLKFDAQAGRVLLIPDTQGALIAAALGLGDGDPLEGFGAAAAALPAGSAWRIEPGNFSQDDAELGFLLGAYRYVSRRAEKPSLASLTAASPRARTIAGAMMLARELINTPANLLGPQELAQTAMALAQRHGAETECVQGAALAERFPAIHTVGAGSDRPAAAVILRWRGTAAGDDAKLVSLCGKGVCFDTGGYDLKPSGAMRLMRKDMGGAAIVLGLASAIMALDLPIRLELRIGCVENSVSGHAMRPSDIIRTRAGLSVEVGNTDAEGRLVLCDLLSEASETTPDWLIDTATLTGAARVALGPDLPALFCNNDSMADTILTAGLAANDPLWRLPLHAGYAKWLETPFADLCNISTKPFAGAITAALFLQYFIPKQVSWAHIDTYAWNDSTRPGKPEGGDAQTLRALLAATEKLTAA